MKKSIGLNQLTMGVCYYPEQWPRGLWADDLSRMQEHGISVIRIGEFAWDLLEPSDGVFDFELFDAFLALVEKTPIKVIFGTPSATPPAWLTHEHPEVLNARCDGTLMRHGMRRHYTYNSAVYNAYVTRIVTELGKHYGHHPSIIGWQLDNEPNCEVNEFYSVCDHQAFRVFLHRKYGTLEKLNEAWGANFWSQRYTSWDQVFLKRPAASNSANPHAALDEKRFISESCIRFCRMQHDCLRQLIAPEQFITTNGMFGHLDNHRLTEECLDFYTYDSYPSFGFSVSRADAQLKDRYHAYQLCKVRSICAPFGVMEQQSGPSGWVNRMMAQSPKPGQMRLWTFQSIAHGADFISYFRWRTASYGTEIYWHGLNDYSNLPNRRMEELLRIREDMRKLSDIAGKPYAANFALLQDYDNEWDGELDQWHGPLTQYSQLEWFRASTYGHTPMDLLQMRPQTQLEELLAYPMLVYPHAAILTEHAAQLLRAYVEHGGVLIMGARTGYKDENGHCPMRAMPGLAADICGVNVTDYSYLLDGEEEVTLRCDGFECKAHGFADVLTPTSPTARVIGVFGEGYRKGQPAVVENELGKGKAVYFGSAFTQEAAEALLRRYGAYEPFASMVTLPACCEASLRGEYLLVLNYSGEEAVLDVHQEMTDVLTQKACKGQTVLEGYGVMALRRA